MIRFHIPAQVCSHCVRLMQFAQLALLVLFAFILVGCKSQRGYDNRHIYIGEIVSLSGSESTFGESSHRGVTLAVEETNARGGISTFEKNKKKLRQIQLIALDNKSNKEKSLDVMRELIEEKNVLAIIGEVASERTKLAAPLAQKHKIPMISPAATNPSVTEIGDYIFRACYIDPFQGYAMAKFARKSLNLSRVAVLKDHRSSYSAGLAEFFVDTFFDLGGEIVAEESYSSSHTEFSDAVSLIKSHSPDGVFIPGYYSQVAEIAKEIRKQNVRSKRSGKPTILLGGDGWDSSELYARGQSAIKGGYFTAHFTPQSKDERAMEFVKKYKGRYGVDPDGQAAMGYDAANILIAAIERVFSKRVNGAITDRVREELSQTKNHPGVTGPITLNENRDAVKPAVILKVMGSTNSYVTTVKP